MTHEEYIKFHNDCCAEMHDITIRKNADYSGAKDGDAFLNFKHVEAFGITSAEKGTFVRLSDKMARISTFLNKGVLAVKDESVDDTILDACNYLIILLGIITDKRGERDADKS